MSTTGSIDYDFGVLRVVPHVHTGVFANIGVVLHARTAGFLGIRTITDVRALRRIAPDLDIDLLQRYLACYEAICRGDESAGPIALVSRSERFHWMTAPRSDVIQPSPVHEGVCTDPEAELDRLFGAYVGNR